MSNFEDLKVWQECRSFRVDLSKLMKKLPAEEKYRLIDQTLRASRSVTALIAEGHGRYHYQENIQFCRQARGSLTECLDHLICMLDEGYITNEELESFREQFKLCNKLINGYVAFLKGQKELSKSEFVK